MDEDPAKRDKQHPCKECVEQPGFGVLSDLAIPLPFATDPVATKILHFGSDECQRLPVLRDVGYFVEECSSIFKLRLAFDSSTLPSAVVMTNAPAPAHREAIAFVRARPLTPLILFLSSSESRDETEFDLVIPALTPTAEWLGKISATIERSRALRANLAALCEQSALLKKDVESVRQHSVLLRERSAEQRAAAASGLSLVPPSPKSPRKS